VTVNKPFDYALHLQEEWLLYGKCPPRPAGNIWRQSEALLEQWNRSSACETTWMEQKIMSCERNIIKFFFFQYGV